MDSVWTNIIDKPAFESLSGEKKTHTLVIGGGIAGILCAHMLQESGVDCMVVEAKRICSGITENTTAKITVQHGLVYSKILKNYGTEAASMYLRANQEALNTYDTLAKQFPCDFETQDSFVYSLNDAGKIEEEAEALLKIGCSAKVLRDLPLPFPVASAVCLPNQAQYHPLKLMYALAKNLKIYENTKVTEWTHDGVMTNKGKIYADNVIVTTHFPLWNKHGAYFLKLYQHRSYVLALRDAPVIKGMYVDESQKGMSFRSYEDLLLVGGGGHRTGKAGGGWGELRSFARSYYPASTEVSHWATQDCMSLDGIPYIGNYSKNTPNVYVVTGFNKWGMTSSIVAAKVLRDLITTGENPFEDLYCPSRSILHPQAFLNIGESLIGLLTPTAPRCPHMGCALKYNKQEHSWDCACHGSRFDKDGRLLNNPATDDKQ